MVVLCFKIVVVLLWFQKCNVTAQDSADLTALGLYEGIFTASMLKDLWLFQAACQSLLSGNALEKFNRHSLRSLVSLFRLVYFLEDTSGLHLPQKNDDPDKYAPVQPVKNGRTWCNSCFLQKRHCCLHTFSST